MSSMSVAKRIAAGNATNSPLDVSLVASAEISTPARCRWHAQREFLSAAVSQGFQVGGIFARKASTPSRAMSPAMLCAMVREASAYAAARPCSS